MTRAHALGILAALALRQGVLLEYEVGDFLACTEKLNGLAAVEVTPARLAHRPDGWGGHLFHAVHSTHSTTGLDAWVYDA